MCGTNCQAYCIILSMAVTAGIAQVLYLFDRAFDGTEWHSLLGNLKPVTPDDWLWVAPGGRRSIRDIVDHVGSAKFLYQHHAFGEATLSWDDPTVVGGE